MSISRVLLVVAFSVPVAGMADVILTDTEHFSQGGGTWNNHSASNWAIWYHQGSDPTTDTPRPFENEPDPLTQDIVIPTGTTTYVFYKNTYNTNDVNNVFHFQQGALTGSITIPGSGGPYQSTSGPIPTVSGADLTLGDTTVSILSFGWYLPTVFGKDFVSTSQTLGAGGGLDDIALVTFRVSAIPEPCIPLLAAALCLAVIARRPRRPA